MATHSPVYALVGPDPFLQQQALTDVLGACGGDVQRSDLEGPAADPRDVFDELRSVAMFGGRRLVVIRDADAFVSSHREAVERYLAAPSPEGVLVLRLASLPKNQKIYKLAHKAGQIIACEPPAQRDVGRWLVTRGKQTHGIRISPDAADLLADLIGNDLGSLDNELAKLALLDVKGVIGAEHVGAAGGVAFRRDQQMYVITDHLTRGDAAGAVRVWRQLLATDDSAEFRAVTWLALWLEKADSALALKGQGVRPFEIAKRLRVWPASNVDALLRVATSLGRPWLRDATARLIELDYRTKTGGTDVRRACEEFLATSTPQ